MKLNKNKIIVSTLALTIGASLAASVSSTIAWYQYSTRANVSFIGESSGFSGNLQMRFKGEDDWRTRITWQEMAKKLAEGNYAEQVMPMTFGEMGRDDALPVNGFVQPQLWKNNMADWSAAEEKHYAQFELELRFNERDGVVQNQQDAKNVERKVYLSKLLIQEDGANGEKGDLSDAVRIHISSSYGNDSMNKLISNKGGKTYTNGKLDLDDDGRNDRAYTLAGDAGEFGFGEGNQLKEIVYGEGSQVSYAAKSELVDGTKWSEEEIVKANAFDKSVDDYKVDPVYFTQEEIDAAQEGDEAYGKQVSDIKVEGVKYTQDEIDESIEVHKAFDKTIGDWKTTGIVYYTQAEIDAANNAHAAAGKNTTSDWKKEPVLYTAEEAAAYNEEHGITDSNDPAYKTSESVKEAGIRWTQAEIDLANAYGGEAGVTVKTPGVKFTQVEIDAAQEGDVAYGKTTDDYKVDPVYFTQDEIDTANAYGKTIYDIKSEPTYFTREEVELANDAYGKTTDDYKVDPIYPALAGSNGNKLADLDFDHDGDNGDGENGTTAPIDKYIGNTLESETEFLTVKVTIWVEGWQELDGSAIWDEVKYIDSRFNVGIQFAVEDIEL